MPSSLCYCNESKVSRSFLIRVKLSLLLTLYGILCVGFVTGQRVAFSDPVDAYSSVSNAFDHVISRANDGLEVPDCAVDNKVITNKAKILFLNIIGADAVGAHGIIPGIRASFWSRGCTWDKCNIYGHYNIEVINQNTKRENIGSVIDDVVRTHGNELLLLWGPHDDSSTTAVLAALKRHGLLSFAPETGSSALRGWNPLLYFLEASPIMELLELLRYFVNTLLHRNIGFMYLQNVAFGDKEYDLARSLLHESGYNISCTFTLSSSLTKAADSTVFDAAWEAFANVRPRVVVVFGPPTADTLKFIQYVLKDKRTAETVILAPSVLHSLVVQAYKKAVAEGVPFVAGRVITTSTIPPPNSETVSAVGRFRTAMRKYLVDEQKIKDPDIFLNDEEQGRAMLRGWLSAEVLFKALSTFEWTRGRNCFYQSLFDQRRYLIDDFFIGVFGGDSAPEAVAQGAVFRCNQGGRNVFVLKVVENFKSELIDSTRILGSSTLCDADEAKLSTPLSTLMMSSEDNIQALNASTELSIGIRAANAFSTKPNIRSKLLMHDASASFLHAFESISDIYKVKKLHAFFGVSTDALENLSDIIHISPLRLTPTPNVYKRHVIHFLPTIEQQMFTLANYLRAMNVGAVNAVIRSKKGADILNIIQRSLSSFSILILASTILSEDEALEASKLPEYGHIIFVGIRKEDFPYIKFYNTFHISSRIMITFEDFSLQYNDFVTAFTGDPLARLLFFVTSLPHWSDSSTTSLTGQRFLLAVPNEAERTPLSMAGFVVGQAVLSILQKLQKVDVESFLHYIYGNPSISHDDMIYGPFFDHECEPLYGEAKSKCEVNYGATRMSVWTMERAINASIRESHGPVIPSMKYTTPQSSRLNTKERAALYLLILPFLVLFIGSFFVWCFCYRNQRSAHAPKDLEDPVTIVFTDIQSSTALWAAIPDIMPDAVATHHRLIRRLIDKYKCYEVKTIGDSFMIACKSASAAVHLVGDLQRTFLHHDWGTSAIDAAYHEFEERQAAEDADYEPPTARLDAAVYRKYWSGLRVRAGVHTGLSDIQLDAVTKRYDYYGSTSNTAARTESVAHGGQVLLTGAAYMALSTAERAGIDVTALGPVELRGVPEPVKMYQLNAVPGRAFAKLRLGRECGKMDRDEGTLHGTETSGSQSDALNPAAENVFTVLQNVLSAFNPQQRLKVLGPICKGWNVDIPEVNNQRDVANVSHLAEERVAIKVSHVMECRELMHNSLTDAADIPSSPGGSSMQSNLSRASSFRASASFLPLVSKRSRDSERQGKSPCVSFRVRRDSIGSSSTSSILLEGPPFIDAE